MAWSERLYLHLSNNLISRQVNIAYKIIPVKLRSRPSIFYQLDPKFIQPQNLTKLPTAINILSLHHPSSQFNSTSLASPNPTFNFHINFDEMKIFWREQKAEKRRSKKTTKSPNVESLGKILNFFFLFFFVLSSEREQKKT